MHHQPIIHEFYAVVETKGVNDHSCQAPDALGPSLPCCPRVPVEERCELGIPPPLTLACFQWHQLHLAWKMLLLAASWPQAAARLRGLALQPAHTVQPQPPISPQASMHASSSPALWLLLTMGIFLWPTGEMEWKPHRWKVMLFINNFFWLLL